MSSPLADRLRPTTLDDVVGQQHITETLKNQIISDRLSHAYLFIGTRGTGKTTCAKILAKALNCQHPENGNPCGKCPALEAYLTKGWNSYRRKWSRKYKCSIKVEPDTGYSILQTTWTDASGVALE